MTDRPGFHIDPPRIVCSVEGCGCELLASPETAVRLAGTGWRCADHDGRWRPGRGQPRGDSA